MPTRTGVATAIVAAAFLAAGRVFGLFELYVLAAAMFALLACASAWVLLNWRALRVNRTVNPPRLHAGDTSVVTLNLGNDRIVPTPVARITDEVSGAVRADAHVPPIRRSRSTRASYRVPTERRGVVEIGPMKTRVTDPFGLAASTRTSAPDTSLLVLPKVFPIPPPPQPGGKAAQMMDRTPNRTGTSGEEFSSLRAYALGDDLRKVHWPSSARTGELVVRTENIPEHGHSLVVLDVRLDAADPATFEKMVSAAASIVVACRDRGDNLRLVTTAGVAMSAESRGACEAMLDMLAMVQQTKATTIALPVEVGRTGHEAGAMILGRDAETLIASLGGGGHRSGTYIVRFSGDGATPQSATPRLPSARMIDIGANADFAALWTEAVGR